MSPQVYFVYFCATAVFVIALVCGGLLFSAGFQKRSRFPLRYCLTSLCLLAFSALITLGYYYVDYTMGANFPNAYPVVITLVSFVMYIAIFLASVLAMQFDFKEKPLPCLTTMAMSYICQHIAYNIYSIINTASSLEISVITNLGYWGYLLCTLVQLLCVAFVLFLVYVTFARRIVQFNIGDSMRSSAVFIVVFSIVIVLVLGSILNFVPAENKIVRIFAMCLLIVCCVFVLILYTNIFRIRSMQNELDEVTRINQSEHEHFLKLKRDMDLVNVKCHDIKHFITVAGARKGVDLSDLSKAVNIYDTTIKTGNDIIDTMLAEHSLYCSTHKINLTVIADASSLSFISVTDMCALFGNIMENAVEAVDKVKDESARLININIRPVAGQVFFCVENSYAVEPDIVDGLPRTTKKYEEGSHGYGLKSIKMISEKYDGVLSYKAENGLFRISILFPIVSEAKTA